MSFALTELFFVVAVSITNPSYLQQTHGLNLERQSRPTFPKEPVFFIFSLRNFTSLAFSCVIYHLQFFCLAIKLYLYDARWMKLDNRTNAIVTICASTGFLQALPASGMKVHNI